MSQLGKIAWLSQPYSTWPSTLLGSGSRVIFIYSPLLDALTMYPHLSPSLSPSLVVFLVFPLSFFVCISPSISVPVPVLAVCRLTDGPLFAVLSYLSGVGWCVWSRCCPPPCGRAEASSAAGHALDRSRRCVWTGNILATLTGPLWYLDELWKLWDTAEEM